MFILYRVNVTSHNERALMSIFDKRMRDYLWEERSFQMTPNFQNGTVIFENIRRRVFLFHYFCWYIIKAMLCILQLYGIKYLLFGGITKSQMMEREWFCHVMDLRIRDLRSDCQCDAVTFCNKDKTSLVNAVLYV